MHHRLRNVLIAGSVLSLTVASICQDAPAGRANATPEQRAEATRQFLGLGAAPDKAAVARGAPVYQENCSFCHGPQARGSSGPNLVTSDAVLGDDHGEHLALFLKKGRPEKGMPAFAQFTDQQLIDVSEFLHQQVEDVANRGTYHLPDIVVGDAAKGKAYVAANCMSCHTSASFDHIAAKYRTPDVLQRSWIWPSRPADNSLAITAAVKMADGSTMTGRVTQVSDFKITLVDKDDETHVIDRVPGVEVKMNDPLAPHLPLIPAIKNDDMHNVTAYLETLEMKFAKMFYLPLAMTALLGSSWAATDVSVDSNTLGKPPVNSWPTFNGDYTAERYSTLKEITPVNVNKIAQQWVYKITAVGAQRGAPEPIIKCTPLMVNGVLYITIPDHLWALDAHTGKELWHYDWVDHGGHLVGQRGIGIWNTTAYFQTPDNWLVALNATTGKELWRKNYADARKQYFSTSAPLVVKNHVLVGVGGDAMDMPGFLDSFDPVTGDLQWTWWSTPRQGDPALATWPDLPTSEHGGGMTWMPGSYDPSLNLIFWPTGNTNPVFAGGGRPGSNLWTESIVALDVDTGKMKWYYQVSPHDTHDFDNTTAPILFDKVVDGKPRKLVAQASRSGYFVTLDRVTGQYLVAKPFVPLDYVSGLSPKGEPIPIPDKDPQVGGSINISNATNWEAPAYNRDTGLFYVNATEGKSIYYLEDTSDHPAGYGGGGGGGGLGVTKRILKAIDPMTGDVVWTHEYPNMNSAPGTVGPSLLTTAGNLVVTGDDQKDFIIYSADKGKILWHASVAANQSNGPITYMLDGKQWIIMAAGDSLYAYSLAK